MKLFTITAITVALLINGAIKIKPSDCMRYATNDREIFCVDRSVSIGLAFIDASFRM